MTAKMALCFENISFITNNVENLIIAYDFLVILRQINGCKVYPSSEVIWHCSPSRVVVHLTDMEISLLLPEKKPFSNTFIAI